MMPLVSIIIPIYNSEKHLVNCLNSVVNQSYVNIECILINDGSTDSSLKICQEFKDRDARIILIDQENKGVSEARNRGLAIAQGNWIMFLDSDDWIETNIIERSLKIVAENESDIIAWNYSKDTPTHLDYKPINPLIITREIDEINFFIVDLMVPHYDKICNNVNISIENVRSACAKLIKKSIIGQTKFITNLPLAEDALFCLHIYQKTNKITFLSDPLYHYTVNPNSAIYKFRPNIESINQMLLEEFLREKPKCLTPKEFNIFKTGLIYECLHNYLEQYFLHRENEVSLFDKIKELKSKSTLLKDLSVDIVVDYKYFPLHQRIAIFLYLNEYYKLLLLYWSFKQKISKIIK